MKKTFLFAAFALVTLASCKKEYTCECTSSISGVSATTSSSTTIKDTKKNAEATCNEGDATSSALGITTTVECELN